MASYGSIFEFLFDSQNGAELRIIISQRNYAGEVYKRPLGRAPLLRRDNNGHIFGTSLEIYAECIRDGEYATLYSSSAYEHMVEVYKDDTLIWTGFVSPELYSEPDIAPPYDVQIVATDGLGELKNYTYESAGITSVGDHLRSMLIHTGVDLQHDLVSALSYGVRGVESRHADILDFMIDLSHENTSTCYDVLQRLLSGLNMSITQYLGRWLLFRETDLIQQASSEGVHAYDQNGYSKSLPVASFGSAYGNDWWPIGNMSSVIVPAKNRIILESPNNYKNNVLLTNGWGADNGAYFDEEGIYILPDAGSNISQVISFEGIEVGYRLALRIRARNVGSGDEDQDIGVMIKINGRGYPGQRNYWLVQAALSDRGVGSYLWSNAEGAIGADLAIPSDSDTDSDAQDIDIIIPLYAYDSRSYMYATDIEVTIFNPKGVHDIHVYDVLLSKYDQFSGLQANVLINNNAREEEATVDLSFTDGASIPSAGTVFMTGIPMLPDGSSQIKEWYVAGATENDYLSVMSYDYSKDIAQPKMSYRGILNVPLTVIPFLFLRDGIFYLPHTYSWNLADDELDVEMISISAADVVLEDIIIAEIAESRGTMPSGSSGGSAGIGGVSGVRAISVNGSVIDEKDGIVTLPDYPTKDEYDEKISALDAKDKAFAEDIAKNAQEIEVLKPKVDNNAKSVKELDKRVGDNETAIVDHNARLQKLEDKEAMFRWVTDEDGKRRIETDYDLASLGTIASGGQAEEGEGGAAGTGTVMAVEVNGEIYDAEDGIVTLPDYPTKDEYDGKMSSLDAKDKAFADGIAKNAQEIEVLKPKVEKNEGDIKDLQVVDEDIKEQLIEIKKITDRFSYDAEQDMLLTPSNLASKKTIASGGAGAEGDGEDSGSSGTLDGLLDVEIDFSGEAPTEEDRPMLAYDTTDFIWKNRKTMHRHPQGVASSVWTITHNLNKVPNVKVIDSTGQQVYGMVQIGDNDGNDPMNIVRISFGGAFSGTAYLD